MAHAGPAALDRLEPLLAELRALGIADEPKRGIFYRRRAAFLHFHEEAGRLLADIKEAGEFRRYAADTKRDWAKIVAAARRAAR